MSPKQKIVHGRGLSNLNLGIFVCSFDVCRALKPVPSINYDGNSGLGAPNKLPGNHQRCSLLLLQDTYRGMVVAVVAM